MSLFLKPVNVAHFYEKGLIKMTKKVALMFCYFEHNQGITLRVNATSVNFFVVGLEQLLTH